ncbi:3-phosphoshikimate 1-carboxyvinyltransferase [Thermoflexales bacterium]|nr:3-phosphoshikimate 1-carboxyvinyltransferase [Thermoflexales bacterium]
MNWVVESSASLRGVVSMPGDKSISHRALMHAVLAAGTSHIQNFLHAGVTEAMMRCVRDLGVGIEVEPPGGSATSGRLIVHGGQLRSPATNLDCHNSGATIRMLLGVLAGQRGLAVTLDGSAGLRRRPMKRVAEPLRLMGAEIPGDTPPLIIHGQPLHGIEYTLPVASAQVKAAMLLAALQAEGPTTIHEPGPSRDHSERMLRALGISVATHNQTVTLTPTGRPLPAFEAVVPGDISSAAFIFAAAALVPDSEVTVKDVGVNETRTGILDVLVALGGAVCIANVHEVNGELVADVTVKSSELRGMIVAGDLVVRMIDEFPIFAVLASQARGETIVREAEELRMKESDRIGSLAHELRQFGIPIEERPDGFVIEGPTRLRGAVVDSHGDHRLALALAVAGLIAEGETTVTRAEAYRESFPNFVDLLCSLGGKVHE